jgi:predicted nucleic acid-binding protein
MTGSSTATSYMTAKSFVDTNVVLYTIGKDARKAEIARKLVSGQPAISTQVVNESISVCLRKLLFTREKAYAFGRTLMDQTDVLPLDEATIDRAAAVAIRYQLSHWDALIVASALVAGCDILYSEDLQHRQVFDERLTVVNPFLDA